MRVLIVSQYFWPESFRINDVALGLRELGHEIEVLTGQPNYPEGRFFDGYSAWRPVWESFQGIPVTRVPLVARGAGRGLRLALNYASFAVAASLLGPLRLRRRFDAILVFEPSPVTVAVPALLLKRLRRTPMLFWVQDLWPESLAATGAVRSRWILALVARLVRLIYRNSDRVLVQSRAFSRHVIALGASPARVIYLPNSAEALYRPIRPAPEVAEMARVPAGFRVMFAGNIGAAQSFGTIIDAAELLREVAGIHWVVLGDGRMRKWAAAEVVRRGLQDRVHFLGRFPTEAMPRFFAAADALLITLKRDPLFALTIPSKLQSYLACGRPIVAALEGEGATVLHEAGAGLVCPPDDARALADAVLRLYRMAPQEREALGDCGRAYFELEFGREHLLRRLVDALQASAKEHLACAS